MFHFRHRQRRLACSPLSLSLLPVVRQQQRQRHWRHVVSNHNPPPTTPTDAPFVLVSSLIRTMFRTSRHATAVPFPTLCSNRAFGVAIDSTETKQHQPHLHHQGDITTTPATADNNDISTTTNNQLQQHPTKPPQRRQWWIPQRRRSKVVDIHDAVSLVRNGNTVSCSGFVAQGAPEAILDALGKRYAETGHPHSLTLVFGGGPGDWDSRGLNHLAQTYSGSSSTSVSSTSLSSTSLSSTSLSSTSLSSTSLSPTLSPVPPCMLRRTIGSHYGQVPKVAALAMANLIEAWTLPMGSVSRMIRAQATHSPGHVTTVGIGTYMDPHQSGGAANEAARTSPLHSELISYIAMHGMDYLLYRALPIDVAIIRGTTADAQGNVSMEKESLLCDQMILATAARNSGGIVIVQVERLAETGSIPVRSVVVPGPLVDCVVVVPPGDHDTLHAMSYVEAANPSYTGLIKTPRDVIPSLPFDIRKLIARRAVFFLKPNTVVNLGIGLPEGVAGVASEEGMLDYVTLSTEPGVFGGLPASGHSFGPASNPDAIVAMNQMFDFYDGGGLHQAFLGAAQISQSGDVNVSRMSRDRLTGPGGFIDISQSTRTVFFLTTFTTKGLETTCTDDGRLSIAHEGSVAKFVPDVLEITFSGNEAVRRGQTVYYITERAVFTRTSTHDTLELIEIAPGVDLQRDILDQMQFAPVIGPHLKEMDARIFRPAPMGVSTELFGSLQDRCTYHEAEHTLFIDNFGITIANEDDVDWIVNGYVSIVAPLVTKAGGRLIHVVSNYDGFDIAPGLADAYYLAVQERLEVPYYQSIRRFAGKAFYRALLGEAMDLSRWTPNDLFDMFDTDGNGTISRAELRQGLLHHFHLHLTQLQLETCFPLESKRVDPALVIDRESFSKGILQVLRTK